MTQPVALRCDRCGEGFFLNLVETPLPTGGVRITVTCPHCEHRYVDLVQSCRVVALRKLIARRGHERPRPGQLAARAALLDRTMARLRREMG